MRDVRSKVEYAMSEIFTKACNDSGNCFTANYTHHFVEVITALVDAETKSWRDAYEEALKNIGMLGTLNNQLTQKLKGKK